MANNNGNVKNQTKDDLDINLDELKVHQETIKSDTISPLTLIREKELEINAKILEANSQAEKIVDAARKKAAKTKEAAESAAALKVDDYISKGVAEAEKEAEDIKNTVAQKIAEIKKIGSQNFDKALKECKKIIF